MKTFIASKIDALVARTSGDDSPQRPNERIATWDLRKRVTAGFDVILSGGDPEGCERAPPTVCGKLILRAGDPVYQCRYAVYEKGMHLKCELVPPAFIPKFEWVIVSSPLPLLRRSVCSFFPPRHNCSLTRTSVLSARAHSNGCLVPPIEFSLDLICLTTGPVLGRKTSDAFCTSSRFAPR